jgi:glycine/D-amino acid oxidase-like deaminating enzyme/nitrite reductase/ring-hydroxylating ferredoxin subunit
MALSLKLNPLCRPLETYLNTKILNMKRDGACISLWQDKMPDYRVKSAGSLSNRLFDVVIVGGGITGITTGLLLQRAGKSVLIAEAHNLGYGTTGGTTAHLNTIMDNPYDKIIKNFNKEKAKLVAKAIRQSLELFRQNIQELKIDCGYREQPGYLYSQDEQQSKELDEIFEASKTCGVEVSVSNTIPVKVPFEKALEFPGQACLHPTRYIYALAKSFEDAGGIIAQDCRITGVEENDVLDISSSRGPIKASNLIYATHIPPGVNVLHFRCAPYRSYAMAVKLKNEEDYPDGLAYDMYDPYHYYRTQEIDGEKYLVVGGEDHKTAHEENTEGRFLALEAYIRQFYEIDRIAFKWSSQYFEPTDGIPYIGNLPGHGSNIYVATGYGGNGITYSGVAALTLSDMLVTGESEFQSLFNPSRIKPVAGFANFVKEAADVVQQFIGGYFSREKLEEVSDLAPGEGKVVRYEGKSLALYKDERGLLHAVNPACTHIKCTIGWNAAEKSWDCPCHGSRFSVDGEVLTGPARKDLEQIRMEELVKH